MKKWYLHFDDQNSGPFTTEEAASIFQSIDKSQRVLACQENSTEWKPAKYFAELNPKLLETEAYARYLEEVDLPKELLVLRKGKEQGPIETKKIIFAVRYDKVPISLQVKGEGWAEWVTIEDLIEKSKQQTMLLQDESSFHKHEDPRGDKKQGREIEIPQDGPELKLAEISTNKYQEENDLKAAELREAESLLDAAQDHQPGQVAPHQQQHSHSQPHQQQGLARRGFQAPDLSKRPISVDYSGHLIVVLALISLGMYLFKGREIAAENIPDPDFSAECLLSQQSGTGLGISPTEMNIKVSGNKFRIETKDKIKIYDSQKLVSYYRGYKDRANIAHNIPKNEMMELRFWRPRIKGNEGAPVNVSGRPGIYIKTTGRSMRTEIKREEWRDKQTNVVLKLKNILSEGGQLIRSTNIECKKVNFNKVPPSAFSAT